MSQANLSRLERCYIGSQVSLRTIPNTAGAWDTTTAKRLRHNRLVLSPAIGYQDAPFKTNTRSQMAGFVDRKGGTWALSNQPAILSGTAGTNPDWSLILKSLFGAASTGNVSTNVYNFADTGEFPFVLAGFFTSSSGQTNRIAWGNVTEEMSFRFNGNVFEFDASGPSGYILDTDNFANEDNIAKAGLTSFPSDPALTTVAGNPQTGFTGTATIDSQSLEGDIGNMTVRIRSGNALVGDRYADAYAQRVVGGLRQVSASISFLDSDSSAAVDVKAKAKSRTPVNVSLVIGGTAGYIATFAFKNVVLVPASFDDGATYVTASFGEGMAHASALDTADEFTLTLS